jgi:RNA polymerase sigma factor (sigma-70 family)
MFLDAQKTFQPLIRRVKAGSEGAWHELDAFYREAVSRWLIAQRVQPADAEELFQDLLIKMRGYILSYDPDKGLFRGLMRKVLENMLKDYWETNKRRARNTTALTDEILEGLTSKESIDQLVSELDPVEVIRNSELWKLAESLLPPNDLKCYLAVECFGRDVKEVAAEFGKSIAAIHQAVHRMRKKIKELRKQFAEDADDDQPDLPE